MANVSSLHDKLFKATMSRLDVAKEFLQEYLPVHIKKLVNLNTLKQEPTEFTDEKMKKSEMDILYSVHFGHRQGYIYCVFEHLSNPDKFVAYRLVKYMFRVMDWHLEKTKAKVLCPIYPVIIYAGTRKYSYSTSFFDLFGDDKKLVEDIFLRPFQLLDIKDIPDKKLQQHVLFGLMAKAMLANAKNALKLVQSLLPNMQGIKKSDLDYLHYVIEYLLRTKDIDDRKKFFHELTTNLSPEAGSEVMTIAQELIQEGMQKGSMETAERIAMELLTDHENIERISKLTKLPKEKIETLKQKVNC